MYSELVIRENKLAVEQALGVELRDYSIKEVDDFSDEIAGFVTKWQKANRQRTTTKPRLELLPGHLQSFVINETRMSTLSFKSWVERHCFIIGDDKKLQRFKLWPSQLYFLAALAREEEAQWERWKEHSRDPEFRAKFRFVVVKSRQVGATRFGQAIGAHLTFLFRNTRSVIASDEPEKSLDLWRLWDDIYENLPWWLQPKRDGRVKGQEHYFPELGSHVITGAGNQKTSLGQGLNVDFFHITEVATWLPEVARMLDKDLFFAFESSRKARSVGLIESTAEGGTENWFHREYELAKSGESRYKPLFIGWFLCPDKWTTDETDVVLTDETLSIGKRIERQNPNVKLTKGQLCWYQQQRATFVAKGELSTMLAECPSDDVEAFQFGVNSVFTAEIREKVKEECKEPTDILRYIPGVTGARALIPATWDGTVVTRRTNPLGGMDGLLFIYQEALPGFVYYIGVDASYGKDEKDAHALEVVRGPTRGYDAMQVAEWRGFCSPGDLDELVWQLGYLYRDHDGRPAQVAPDTTEGSPAIVCLTKLVERGYPNLYIYIKTRKTKGERIAAEYGYKLTGDTRPPLLARGMEAIKNGELIVNSPGVEFEMGTFVKKTNDVTGRAKIEHADGHHDDRLIALFIAYYIATEEGALINNDAELRFMREMLDEKNLVRRPEMQEVLGTTPQQWMDEWERMNGL